jgi:hypothetical protein
MEAAVERGRGRWSTAFGLTLAVLLLSVFDALAIVLLPLAILVIALPTEQRLKWVTLGLLLWLLVILLGGGPLAPLSRGWSMMLGATFLGLTMIRPEWSVITRGLATVAAAFVAGGVGLALGGEALGLDGLVREHFRTVSALTLSDLRQQIPDAPWVDELSLATEQIVDLQADLYPALLGLQSLAGLALAAWWTRRIRRSDSDAFTLAPMREFRFSDQLIWILIAGLALYLLPIGTEPIQRFALNVLVFMGALYALRGLAVFVFLAHGTRSIATIVLGAIALVVLYPVAITAALLMGVGDTWLDVRSRAAAGEAG